MLWIWAIPLILNNIMRALQLPDHFGDFLAQNMSSKVHPCDNFFRHTCHELHTEESPWFPNSPIGSVYSLDFTAPNRNRRSLFYDSVDKIDESKSFTFRMWNLKHPLMMTYIEEYVLSSQYLMGLQQQEVDNIKEHLRPRISKLPVRVRPRMVELRERVRSAMNASLNPTSRYPGQQQIIDRMESILSDMIIFINYVDHVGSDLEDFDALLNKLNYQSTLFEKRYTVKTSAMAQTPFDLLNSFMKHWMVVQPLLEEFGGRSVMGRFSFVSDANTSKFARISRLFYFALPGLLNSEIDDSILYGAIAFIIGHEVFHALTLDAHYPMRYDDRYTYFYKCVTQKTANACNLWPEGPCYSGRRSATANTEEEDACDFFGVQVGTQAFFDKLSEDQDGNSANHIVYKSLNITRQQLYFYSIAITFCNVFENSQHKFNEFFNSFDMHSAEQTRINMMLANTPKFAEAFSCKTGDRMVQQPSCFVH